MTSLTQSRFEMILSLTSGHSSFSWLRNSGKRCSMVLQRRLFQPFRYIAVWHFDLRTASFDYDDIRWQFHSLVLSEDGWKSHDNWCEGRLDVLVSVHHELLHAGQYVVHDDGLLRCSVNFNLGKESKIFSHNSPGRRGRGPCRSREPCAQPQREPPPRSPSGDSKIHRHNLICNSYICYIYFSVALPGRRARDLPWLFQARQPSEDLWICQLPYTCRGENNNVG